MTSSRARLIRAAAPVALAGAMLAGYAAPAAAAPPAIRILRVSSESVPSGGTVQVRFQATNNNQRTEKVFVAVSGGLRCTAGCAAAPDLGPGKSRTFEATVVAPEVGPGEESGRNLAVSVRIGTQTAFDHKMIIVRGGNTPSSSAVSRVTGRVRDADGKAITGASLTVRDSAGHEYRTTSDGKGRFSIKASDSKPIAAGSITVVADKDGYRAARATVQGTARGATVRLVLTALPTPTKTSPSPTAAESTPATAGKPAPKASLAGVVPPATRTADDDSGSFMFTLVGGLLVAAGLGTLVLMVIRRRKRSADPDLQSTQVMAA
ncbi:carboxypeptidase-like regulatory domain-containing protein, partial [Actinoplanes sp. NPDC048791]|uniref:carboxypeptidase-like regulatory domain-containing protein n=1 Tax=Actinoplanes sp. NPDC048791 TaxID=3154623 RepID=UPI0033DBB406